MPVDQAESARDGQRLAISSANADLARPAGALQPTRKILLGEELPVFCEKCGYALHGLAQQVCSQCEIRQFHCPECGHHQPINTLRPAAQKILGRMRAFFLAVSVFFKINFFCWLVFAWVSMGYHQSYTYHWASNEAGIYSPPSLIPRELDKEAVLSFGIFGLFFGMFGRMLLLRWRRGYLVGLILAVLVCLAILLGAIWRKTERTGEFSPPSPFTSDFLICTAIAAIALFVGASTIWGIWSALAQVFLPKRTSAALLDWQSNQSNPAAASLARE